MDDGQTTDLVVGKGMIEFDSLVLYSGPVWSSDGQQLAFLRTDRKDRWSAIPAVGVYRFADKSSSMLTEPRRVELHRPELFRLPNGDWGIEQVQTARHGLFAVSPTSGEFRLAFDLAGDNTLFRFSADGRNVAYVHQSLNEPPEIMLSSYPRPSPRRLTSLNRSLDDIALPRGEAIRWKSLDGVEASGWLYRPSDCGTVKPCPLLTLVHGGPTFAAKNVFLPYLVYWPFPLHVFAARGYAIFIPNYRGTASFGKAFQEPTGEAEEPAEDVWSGISHLVKLGVADADKLGIMGQSHGAWLGPLVVTRHHNFRAASFAEGGGDTIARYGENSGFLNLEIHEYYTPGSPYDNLERYVANSPVFHMRGVNTATLLECGEESGPIAAFRDATAYWRHGIPHEMVVYPNTFHTITIPSLMLESMQRNLDWFDYWMLGKKDPDSKKVEQYERWRKMEAQMADMRRRGFSTPANPRP